MRKEVNVDHSYIISLKGLPCLCGSDSCHCRIVPEREGDLLHTTHKDSRRTYLLAYNWYSFFKFAMWEAIIFLPDNLNRVRYSNLEKNPPPCYCGCNWLRIIWLLHTVSMTTVYYTDTSKRNHSCITIGHSYLVWADLCQNRDGESSTSTHHHLLVCKSCLRKGEVHPAFLYIL